MSKTKRTLPEMRGDCVGEIWGPKTFSYISELERELAEARVVLRLIVGDVDQDPIARRFFDPRLIERAEKAAKAGR